MKGQQMGNKGAKQNSQVINHETKNNINRNLLPIKEISPYCQELLKSPSKKGGS